MSLYESDTDHSSEVLCRFVETREDSSALFDSSDEPLNDISVSVGGSVEFD